ncbi:aminopeptidase P family protein [Rarobacter incanus]|nr:aminopeptidase P family protein [Rarobacter incanus]
MTNDDQAHSTDSLARRGTNRSQRPTSSAFSDFIMGNWAPREPARTAQSADAPYAARRRARLGRAFPATRLVIPAGGLRQRSNDTDYRFRPHSAFAHLSALGTDREPDAVLVIDVPDADASDPTPKATLFFRPLAERDNDEFFADPRYGEFWVGARPTLDEVAVETGMATAHIDTLPDRLAKDVGSEGMGLLVMREADAAVTELVDRIRAQSQLPTGPGEGGDDALFEATSELRLVKDDAEIGHLREAVAATASGFEAVIRALPQAIGHERGERVVEATFDSLARVNGNAVGYETIAAAGPHATTLHWIRNDGQVRDGQLLLLDAGVEVDSLYTADITRTIPISGRFSDAQRRVYEAVLEAADAAFAVALPGNRFRDVHAAAMRVIAAKLDEWGLLPVSAEESLAESGQFHRRWMVHGTSHHLGLDVHDCAQARRELYVDGVLEPGMVFTIEPGLYFKPDDQLIPQEFRGIGVRIEDDVLITQDGCENLSAALPRTPDDVESWIASLRH